MKTTHHINSCTNDIDDTWTCTSEQYPDKMLWSYWTSPYASEWLADTSQSTYVLERVPLSKELDEWHIGNRSWKIQAHLCQRGINTVHIAYSRLPILCSHWNAHTSSNQWMCAWVEVWNSSMLCTPKTEVRWHVCHMHSTETLVPSKYWKKPA